MQGASSRPDRKQRPLTVKLKQAVAAELLTLPFAVQSKSDSSLNAMFFPQKVYFIKCNFPKSPQSIFVLWLGGLAGTGVRRQRHEGRIPSGVLKPRADGAFAPRHTAGTRADCRQASNYSPQKTSQRLQSRRPHPLNPLIRRPSSRIRQSRKIAAQSS